MLISDPEIAFRSKECKTHLHDKCKGSWCGLNIKASCDCDCHNSRGEKASERVSRPGSDAIRYAKPLGDELPG